MTLLNNVFCFELPSGSRVEEHIETNQKRIDRADGLMAPINGIEAYVSVGCGHTSQWCKQVDIGGLTCEEKLAISPDNMCIDKQSLFQDGKFETMVDNGWGWWVFKAEIDVCFPSIC